MTPTFTARAFDELCSREAQPGSAEFGRPRVLGFAGFAAFHAAWQHRMEPGALRFLFPCLCQPGSSSLYRVRAPSRLPLLAQAREHVCLPCMIVAMAARLRVLQHLCGWLCYHSHADT